MRIINLNPGTDIGASGWFVDIENHRLLLDAGTHPKREGLDSLPLYKLIKREELDAIAFVTSPSRRSFDGPISERYLQALLRGMKQSGLPADYIESLPSKAQ